MINSNVKWWNTKLNETYWKIYKLIIIWQILLYINYFVIDNIFAHINEVIHIFLFISEWKSCTSFAWNSNSTTIFRWNISINITSSFKRWRSTRIFNWWYISTADIRLFRWGRIYTAWWSKNWRRPIPTKSIQSTSQRSIT